MRLDRNVTVKLTQGQVEAVRQVLEQTKLSDVTVERVVDTYDAYKVFRDTKFTK